MPAASLPAVLQEFPNTSEIESIRTQMNALIVAFYGLLGKLDADAGVTDANYVATYGAAASQVTTHL